MRYLRQLVRSHSHSPNVGMNDYFDCVAALVSGTNPNCITPRAKYVACRIVALRIGSLVHRAKYSPKYLVVLRY